MISLAKQSFFRNLLKPVILLAICGMLPFGVSAQQEPQITLNMFNHMAVNPGYAGLRDAICVTGIIRQQWMGIEDAEGTKVSPETYVISGDSPVRLLRGGVSAVVMQDKIGYFKEI